MSSAEPARGTHEVTQPEGLDASPDYGLAIEALKAEIAQINARSKRVPVDDMRRRWGYALIVIAVALPVIALAHIMCWSPPLTVLPPSRVVGPVELGAAALWILYGLPLLGSLLVSGALLATAARLQMSADVVEIIEQEKAKAGAQGLVQLELPKRIQLDSNIFRSGKSD